MRWTVAMVVATGLSAVGAIYLQVAGSAVVVDETNGVVSAAIIDTGGGRQPLVRLWTGYFYAIPRMEGTIELKCRNGVRMTWGYVTGHLDTKLRVVGNRPCERIVEKA